MNAPLKGDALAHLRHELRTPFNQLLGYTAILLEDAEPGGFGTVAPALTGIQAGGRALLERIQSALSESGDGVSFEQLAALESTVRPEAEQLLEAATAIGGRLRALEAMDAVADAGRMSDALRNLLSEVQWTPPASDQEVFHAAERSDLVPAGPTARVTENVTGRLLVVEDDNVNRALLRRRLEREGHHVQEAENGMRALQRLDAAAYDLMLLDVIMPEMDGYEVLARLKRNPSLHDLPVIMISALDETQSMVRCIEMGAEDYLTKPFDPVLLRARIGASLEKKRLRDRERGRTAELEQALQQLKEAQTQLVVQEKMASLGALTVGIAHEIKNPLNFVNNFADVSTTLLEDLRHALAEQAPVEEIIADLTSNLRRIRDHGERADGIVRGMLAHARGTGLREPTDINALVAGAVDLAYQGLRTQDGRFSITFENSYDPNLPVIQAVASDLSRAFLNIANNGCYAAHQKSLQLGENFRPTLRVSTHQAGGQIEVRMEDNGAGISKDALAKIFNPFFTTKPPGSGMGLGLSLSYQIVVEQHKGTIRVETRQGESTALIISLPIALPIVLPTGPPAALPIGN